jgi:hypothetical protein
MKIHSCQYVAYRFIAIAGEQYQSCRGELGGVIDFSTYVYWLLKDFKLTNALPKCCTKIISSTLKEMDVKGSSMATLIKNSKL